MCRSGVRRSQRPSARKGPSGLCERTHSDANSSKDSRAMLELHAVSKHKRASTASSGGARAHRVKQGDNARRRLCARLTIGIGVQPASRYSVATFRAATQSAVVGMNQLASHAFRGPALPRTVERHRTSSVSRVMHTSVPCAVSMLALTVFPGTCRGVGCTTALPASATIACIYPRESSARH